MLAPYGYADPEAYALDEQSQKICYAKWNAYIVEGEYFWTKEEYLDAKADVEEKEDEKWREECRLWRELKAKRKKAYDLATEEEWRRAKLEDSRTIDQA